MRLIDADELVEHAWRDKLDSRELIAQMIENAPTVKEIPTKIPISVFEKLILQEPKTGRWIRKTVAGCFVYGCDNCGWQQLYATNFCPDCRTKMVEP